MLIHNLERYLIIFPMFFSNLNKDYESRRQKDTKLALHRKRHKEDEPAYRLIFVLQCKNIVQSRI